MLSDKYYVINPRFGVSSDYAHAINLPVLAVKFCARCPVGLYIGEMVEILVSQ